MSKLKKFMVQKGLDTKGLEAAMKDKGLKEGDSAVVMVDDDENTESKAEKAAEAEEGPALKKYKKKGGC